MTKKAEVKEAGSALVPVETKTKITEATEVISAISKRFVQSIRDEMKSNDKIVGYFGEVKVKTAADLETAVAILAAIKTFYKAKAEGRETIIGPAKDAIKAADAEFKKFKDYIELTLNKINVEIFAFREKEAARLAKINAEREEKEAAARKKIEDDAKREAKQKGADKDLIEYKKNEALEKAETKFAPKEQATTVGTTSFPKRWVGEVEDEKKVPREYLCVDQVAINKAVREGVRVIPGVKIYEKENTSTRI